MGAEQSGDAEHKHSDYNSSGKWDHLQWWIYDFLFFLLCSVFIKLIFTEANHDNSMYVAEVHCSRSDVIFKLGANLYTIPPFDATE